MMHRNKSVDVHQFAMVPRPEIPRSAFRMQKGYKTTFDAGVLIPIYVNEVLPGDTFSLNMTCFARMATPIFPVMDNLYLESWFFFVPCRLVWGNWKKFMGEQDNPADSISFTIPQIVSAAGGFPILTIYDYMGLPTVGQVGGGNTVAVNVLPLRCYNRIYNEWFRDENLEDSLVQNTGNGPDLVADYNLVRRGKRHDYFTSCLPWTQKGGVNITVPISGQATVRTSASQLVSGAQEPMRVLLAGAGATPTTNRAMGTDTLVGNVFGTFSTLAGSGTHLGAYPMNLYADLSTATSVTINALRQSFQIQRLLERDARGGTRYGELVRAHFGVSNPDARLQRSEYLGGGITSVHINPVAQTSATGLTGGTAPLGNLSAFATALGAGHGFTGSFSEHGYIIGIVSVRADLTYQQGLRKLWSRSTRYDFYFPAFAMLGEQAVLSKEIYCDGSAGDNDVFGYQERWAELRYDPSQITGLFKSTSAGTIDGWHLAQRFTVRPILNAAFIRDNPPMSRVLAVGAGAAGQQFIADFFFDTKAGRPLPLYSVPGLIDHF